MSGKHLRVAVAAPLSAADGARIQELEPRIELAYEPGLLPPMRWAADFSGDPLWTRTATQQAAYDELVSSADALYGIPDVDPAALARAIRSNPHLRWVHTMAAGGGGQVRAAALSAAELEHVIFTTSTGIHGGPLAEFAVFGVLAGAKDLARLRRQQREHNWSGRWEMGQISAQTVLVLGLGGIGRVVAEKLGALGATVIATSRHDAARPGETVPGAVKTIHPDRIIEVAPGIDAVVNTLPGTDATHHLLGDTFFAALKPGATVVNVGRGTVIDENALVTALDTERVGFAALDVFETEPLPSVSSLWDRDNVIVSPHTAALDAGEERAIAELFAANATRLLNGEPLANVVDTVEFY